MGQECYLLKGDAGREVEISMDDQQHVRKLINKLADTIGANPSHIRIQGANGLIMLGSQDTQKLKDCLECPVVTFKIGGFEAGHFSLNKHI